MSVGDLVDLDGVSVFACPSEGPLIRGRSESIDVIGEAYQREAEWVAVPVERLPEEFFTLSTGIAGEVMQIFVNYQMRLAIVGDVSGYVAGSSALRDFVYETNRGHQVWFVASEDELRDRLRG